MSDNNRTKPRKKSTLRRTFTAVVLTAAVAVGWLLNDCLGLGIGTGLVPGQDQTEKSPARVQRDSAPPPPLRCNLRLSSRGLTLNRKPVELATAVRTCKKAKEVKLRVTGGARSGTYDEVKRAFEEAKIPIDVRDGRGK